jgi:FtsP/CotA-like multicopper oxidase with cupredoxin domain
MDLNDIDYDAYLANDRTLDDPEVVRTERGGRVRLRLINGATATSFWIDLGGANATLVAVDGDAVVPLVAARFPIAQGQRLDLMIDVPAGASVPVFAQREGDLARTGIVLAAPGATITRLAAAAATAAPPVDLTLEARLTAVTPLANREADLVRAITLGGSMAPYVWTIDGRTWLDRDPIRVARGQRIVLDVANRSMMMHPMHLHGHHFQVVGLNGVPLSGAMRDTVMVPAMGSVRIAFDADNPGRWLFHCHNLFHMATGMMTEVVYDGA